MVNKDDKLVSIIIPCSRVDAFFEPALSSIIYQTYKNIEVIIVANGVTSEEFLQLKELCTADQRIRLLHTNIKGLTFALNFGINESRGEYIARMDADDISDKERIEKQVGFLNDNPDYDVVGCKVVLIDENNNILRKQFPFIEKHEDISKTIFFRNVMCHPALVFRKNSLLAVGGYKFGFMSEDHELFIRMIVQGMKFYNIKDALFSYRKHSAQITDISNAWRHFFEISSFLYMHAFIDKKFKCFAGIVVVFPPLRKVHNFLRSRFFNAGAK